MHSRPGKVEVDVGGSAAIYPKLTMASLVTLQNATQSEPQSLRRVRTQDDAVVEFDLGIE